MMILAFSRCWLFLTPGIVFRIPVMTSVACSFYYLGFGFFASEKGLPSHETHFPLSMRAEPLFSFVLDSAFLVTNSGILSGPNGTF